MARLTKYILLILLALPIDLFAMEVFKFTDSSGTVHFTNVPTDPRYRKLKDRQKISVYPGKEERHKIHAFIEKEAAGYGVEPALVKAVIRAESNYDHRAVSHVGAQGLMQIMPATAEDLEIEDPFDPEENIRGGIRYLRYLLDMFNQDMQLAIAGYHAGPGNVIKHGKIPPIKETRIYVSRVLRFYKDYLSKGKPRVYQSTRSTGELVYTNRPEQYTANLTVAKFKE